MENKVYVVMHDEEGAFIGHGLYDTHQVTDSIHANIRGAEIKKAELERKTGITHFIAEKTVE